MSAFTPGPWTPFTETFDSAAACLKDVEHMLAAGGTHNFTMTAVAAHEGNGEHVMVAFLGNGPRGPAHARLIAAAPDLLEALEDLLKSPLGIEFERVSRAMAAVRKARGDR